ncbi:MAG: PorV/PorQ family protein [Endomicrobium sp.]|jgi:tetratricopeptide (TPR) repeat protein|nr:PorV/PorQ family protein [Endomicrobium sp.]
MQNSDCKIKVLLFFLAGFLLFAAQSANAQKRQHFLSYGAGVAAAGMAGAFTAIGDDMSVSYYNPALLPKLDAEEIAANYWTLMQDSKYMFFGFETRIGDSGSFAMSASQLSVGDIEVRETLTETGRKESAAQTLINGAYGGYIEKIKLNYGVGIKYLYYDILGYRDSGGSLDLGAAYRIKEWKKTSLDAGVVMQNIINIPVKLNEESESVPFIIKSGIGLKTFVFPKYDKDKDKFTYDELRVALDAGLEDSELIYAFGVQYTLFEILMLRAGFDGDISFGLGFKAGGFQLDYAYQLNKEQAINKMGFSFKWGQSRKAVYSRTKTITEDFQDVYRKANRIYDRYVRDAASYAENGKIDKGIELLNKTIPLKPEDNSAKELLVILENKRRAEATNSYIESAKKYQKSGKQKEAYKECLNALKAAPDANVKAVLETIYNAKDKEIVKMKEDAISKFKKEFDERLQSYDFYEAEVIVEKLAVLTQVNELSKKLAEHKKLYADKFAQRAEQYSQNGQWDDAYKCYAEALRLIPNDISIADRKKTARSRYYNRRKLTSEEKMYTEKIYYNAAIALALNEKPLEAWQEIDSYNPVFEWNEILEEYLVKNNIVNKFKI